MTIKDFLNMTNFCSDELSFDIHKDGKLLTKHWLSIEELHNYSDEILSTEIKNIDFFASGYNSGETDLTIDFYL